MKKINCGINGFGRFGLHLLKYWLGRAEKSSFIIKAINDNYLKPEDIVSIINNDYAVIFNSYKIILERSTIKIISPNGENYYIKITNEKDSQIPWIGDYDLFFECSGLNTSRKSCAKFLHGKTKLILISAFKRLVVNLFVLHNN